MNQQTQQQFGKPSMMARLNQYEWLIWLPALSVALLHRNDIGRRLLHRGYISGVTIIMLFIAYCSNSFEQRFYMGIFAVWIFIVGIFYSIKRWHEFNRHQKQHSYYLGSSGLRRVKGLQAGEGKNRRLERFGDPGLSFFTGVYALSFAPAVGLWMMFASVCLFAVEMQTWKQWRTMQMDMVDGLVHSEFKGEAVERFESGSAVQQRQETAIATGLDDDIAEKIRRKRASQAKGNA